jgi:hypothetical protein
MSRDTELSALVGAALFTRQRDAARALARSEGCPVWIIRTKSGFACTGSKPPFGEHWLVEPSGQMVHVPGPVV